MQNIFCLYMYIYIFYFLFADLVGFYTHWTYMHIFRHIFLSNYWWQKSDIWSQASYRYPYRGKRFWTRQIPTSCLPTVDFYTHWTYILYMPIFSHIFLSNYWWQKSAIWSQASYRYPISWSVFGPVKIPTSCLPILLTFYTHLAYIWSSTFFVTFF